MATQKFDPIIHVPNDGLATPEIGIWGLKKYRLLGTYCDIFTRGMKNKWDKLVYVDLFAGAGHAKIKNDNRIVKTSSLIAMSIPFQFTDYILCDENPSNINALDIRIKNNFPNTKRTLIQGDSNKKIDHIIASIPKDPKTLTFCFVDPFSLKLEFNTIAKLANIARVDFLILLAFQMDARRNLIKYSKPENITIDKFVGDLQWRSEFPIDKQQGNIFKEFTKYLGDKYDRNFLKLGYKNPPKKQIIKTDKELGLYYLGFYSKHARGNEFFEKIERYKDFQLKLQL